MSTVSISDTRVIYSMSLNPWSSFSTYKGPINFVPRCRLRAKLQSKALQREDCVENLSVNVSLHTHTYTHLYIYIHTHTYTHTYTHLYIYIHTHIHTLIYIHTHTYTHLYIYVYTYIHTHTHIYIHIHTHIYTYTQREIQGEFSFIHVAVPVANLQTSSNRQLISTSWSTEFPLNLLRAFSTIRSF